MKNIKKGYNTYYTIDGKKFKAKFSKYLKFGGEPKQILLRLQYKETPHERVYAVPRKRFTDEWEVLGYLAAHIETPNVKVKITDIA